jgi:hypothetical protein
MMHACECDRPQQGGVILRRRQTANMQQSKAALWPGDSSNIGGQSAVVNVNDPVASGERSCQQIGSCALADSDDPIAATRRKRKFQLATYLVWRLNQAVPGHYDGLHSGKTGWKSSNDRRSSIVTMYDVRPGALERLVQATHQMKKRGGTLENNFKAFRPQIFTEDANLIKTVD